MKFEVAKKHVLGWSISITVFLSLLLLTTMFISSDFMFPIPGKIVDGWNMTVSEDPLLLEGSDLASRDIDLFSLSTFKPSTTYVRMSRSFDSLMPDQYLLIYTQYNPIMVKINGEEILNKGYRESYYANTRISAFYIEEEYKDCTVDIYFSTQNIANIKVLTRNANDWVNARFLFSLIFAAILIVLGIFFILCSIGARLYQKGTRKLVFASILVLFNGFLLTVRAFSSIYTTGDVNLFKLEVVFVMLISLLSLCICFSLDGKMHFISKAFIFISALYIVTTLAYPEEHVFNILYTAFPAVCLLFFILSLIFIAKSIPMLKIKIIVPTIMLAFSVLYLSLNSVYGILPTQCLIVGITSCVLIVMYGLDFLPGSVLNSARAKNNNLQITHNSVLFDNVISLSAQVFSSKSMTEFCRNMAQSLKNIILEDMVNTVGGAPGFTDILRATVATKEGDNYCVVYTDNEQEQCNFDVIEKRILDSGSEYILFGVTYVDVYLRQNDDVYAICHINGLKRGISEDLKNILKTTYAGISNAFENLNLKNEIVEIQNMVFFNLAHITEARNQETGDHIRRVAGYTKVICLEYGMSEEESELVSQASIMHDLGKLAISEKIIKKKGALTKKERSIMKNHVIWGFNILSGSPGEFMNAAAIIAQQHHEQMDGSGYIGLVGEEIHPYARIVAVADVFDALTTERAYKKAWSLNEAKIFINERVDMHFERKAVDAFNKSFDKIIKIYRQQQSID